MKNLVKSLLAALMLSAVLGISEDLIDLTEEIYNQTYWQKRIFFHSPFFKMKKRHVTYFPSGHLDTITLIFQSNKPFHVRWFRKMENDKLANSEVAYKLPVEGDPNFSKSVMRSRNLWASKLKVVGLTKSRDFETVVSSADGTFQYRIGTKVESWSSERSHEQEIEAPNWLVNPPKNVVVKEGRKLALSCAALVSEERSGFTDELILYQESTRQAYNHLNATDAANSYLHPPDQNYLLKVQKLEIFSTHKDAKGRVENHRSNLLSAKTLEPYSNSKDIVYQVGLTAYNVSARHSGKYYCSFDRRDDRLLVLTSVRVVDGAGEDGVEGSHRKIEGFGRGDGGMNEVYGRNAGELEEEGSTLRYASRRKKFNRRNHFHKKFQNSKRQNRLENSFEFNSLRKKEKIQVEVMSCEKGRMLNGVWMVKKGESSCLRCRGKGGGNRLKVKILRDGTNLKNLAEKGLHKTLSKNRRNRKVSVGRTFDGKRIFFTKRQVEKRNFTSAYNIKKRFVRKVNGNNGAGSKKIDLSEDCSNNHHQDSHPSLKCLGLEAFVNVADGGVHESTLTLHNPHPSSFPQRGHVFTCEARDGEEHKAVQFSVRYYDGEALANN